MYGIRTKNTSNLHYHIISIQYLYSIHLFLLKLKPISYPFMSLQASSPTLSGTFYNLTSKRTLPRQILKWMQGLDLSYSVKDYRKDMSNGFLIAEIISRYEPGKIPMHAFQNSQSSSRRENNWNQLHLFFRKYAVRDVKIGSQEYYNVMMQKDTKSEQLYQFVCRLYSVCTKRAIPQNAPALDVPPTQTNNPNLTASYLLKDDGLQKLEQSGVSQLGNSRQRPNQEHKIQEKPQQRVPTRKIVPSLDGASGVDVTGINIRTDNRKVTSKRKSWEVGREDSNYSEENGENQRLIFDYLNEIILECLPADDSALRQLLNPENGKYQPTQSLRKVLPNIDRDFFCSFLHQISANVSQLTPIILRQLNQIWKFFIYFLRMFKHFPSESQQFTLLIDLVRSYAGACHTREARRLQKVFGESIINVVIGEAKAARQWKKRQKIMGIVYDFQGQESAQKRNVLGRLKDSIGSNTQMFIQWLSVLVRQQTRQRNNLGNRLIEDYIYYAHQHISSSCQAYRTSSLKIFYEISKTQSFELIQAFFYSKAESFQQSTADPEQILLLALIYLNLLKQLINSTEYHRLVKGTGTNTLVKVYNPDNQKNLQQLKRKSHLLGETVYRLFNATSDVTVRQICARLSLPLISESQPMMQMFLQFIAVVREKQQFIHAQSGQYQLKSLLIKCPAVEVTVIQEYANQILVEIISLMMNSNVTIESYLYLINHSLKNLNIKKVNMEIWEDISLHIAKPYTGLTTDASYSNLAFEGIQNICMIQFNYDMKIRELAGWIAENAYKILNKNDPLCKEGLGKFNEFLNREYKKNKQESIRFLAQEISDLLENKGHKDIILLQDA